MTSQRHLLDFGFVTVSTHTVLDSMYRHSILLASVTTGLAVVLVVRYLRSPWRKLPPGPPGYPLVGNAFELKGKQWLQFSAWRKIYGALLSIKIEYNV